MCINEELVGLGFAIAVKLPTELKFESPQVRDAYDKVVAKILRAEIKAEKKGAGIWKETKQESWFTRIKNYFKKN